MRLPLSIDPSQALADLIDYAKLMHGSSTRRACGAVKPRGTTGGTRTQCELPLFTRVAPLANRLDFYGWQRDASRIEVATTHDNRAVPYSLNTRWYTLERDYHAATARYRALLKELGIA